MDGDCVTEEPSETQEHLSLAEIFTDVCPFYISIGMTYNQFWHCNTKVHKAYRKAWEIGRKSSEFDRWRQGMYFYDALLRVSPVLRAFINNDVKPMEYPDMPYPLTEKEAQEQKAQRELRNFLAFKEKLEAESERNSKKLKEQSKKAEVREDG